MRTRAITFPRRRASASASNCRYPSTAGLMSIVVDGMPSASITNCASARLEGCEVLYGMRIARTFCAPSARTHKYAVTAESTPPDSPITARGIPRRAISSSRKNATSQSVVSAASIPGGAGDGAGASTIGSIMAPPRQRKLFVLKQVRQDGRQVAQQRQICASQIDLAQVEIGAHDASFGGWRLHENSPARIDDARGTGHAFPALETRQPGVDHVNPVLARGHLQRFAPARYAFELAFSFVFDSAAR